MKSNERVKPRSYKKQESYCKKFEYFEVFMDEKFVSRHGCLGQLHEVLAVRGQCLHSGRPNINSQHTWIIQ